jgi:hypothetical protein
MKNGKKFPGFPVDNAACYNKTPIHLRNVNKYKN